MFWLLIVDGNFSDPDLTLTLVSLSATTYLFHPGLSLISMVEELIGKLAAFITKIFTSKFDQRTEVKSVYSPIIKDGWPWVFRPLYYKNLQAEKLASITGTVL